MSVKVIEAINSTKKLEKLINEFLEKEPMIKNPKFHYSTTSTGYYDQNTDNGDITVFYSVLISWD